MTTGVGVTGVTKAEVDVTVTLLTANGDQIWTALKTARSDNTTGIVGGVYDWTAMDEMLLNAIDKASSALFTDLKKGIDKL